MALLDKLKNWIGLKERNVEAAVPLRSDQADQDTDTTFAAATIQDTDAVKRRRLSQLTECEFDLYNLLLEGFTLKESSKQLSIKYSTANTHMTKIYKKLGVQSRAELIINYHNINQSANRRPTSVRLSKQSINHNKKTEE